jgi:3-oxoacyl-[acyl-carrier protein] reductase
MRARHAHVTGLDSKPRRPRLSLPIGVACGDEQAKVQPACTFGATTAKVPMLDENGKRPERSEYSGENDLRGATAVVTGSSGGIGRAIAWELAAAGAAVLIHGRENQLAADDTARHIAEMPGQSQVLLCDLANVSEHEQFVDRAWQWRNGVDIWVNNAGVDVLTGEGARLSFDEKLQRLWQVDVRATLRLSRLVGKRMKDCKQGVIVNIGWDQAEFGMAGESGELFSTIKGAVMSFTKSLAQSLAPEVRVNCVAPGWIKTSWGEQAPPYWQQRACRESLLERWGTPGDVARVVRFIASPAASFVTGQVISVNGGYRFGSVGQSR